MKFFPACVALAGTFLLCPLTHAAVDDDPPPPVQPTVTVHSGDTGGTIFGEKPDPKKTRRYYVAAEPAPWDFLPAGRDLVCGLTPSPAVIANRERPKLRYIQYTDETFTARVLPNPSLGVMGPVLRGVVGEFLVITFLNRTTQPVSMHPHGVRYDKHSEGAYYRPNPGRGAAVEPGAKFTYVWQLDESSGPLPSEPSSKGWLYHSHVNGDEEANMGLIGFIIVADPARARADATPTDVDREQAALFMIFDESGLGEAEREAAEYASLSTNNSLLTKTWAQTQELIEQGSRHAINGYIFGNTPGLDMNEGERVRWYLFGLGSEKDFHTAHWHGLRVIEEGRRRTDVVELLPATMKIADMVADNPGAWLFHCHVADHMTEGMFARVTVHAKNSGNRAAGRPYFGLVQGQQSLNIKTAEAVAKDASGKCALKLEGTVTVFDAFSVFTQPVQFHLGAATASFKPNRTGTAQTPDGSFRVKNVSQFGVVYGGQLEFEATLNSAAWCAELEKLGVAPMPKGAPVSAPLTLRVGEAQHTAIVPITGR